MPVAVINEVELLVLEEELEYVADERLEVELLGDVGLGLPGFGVVGAPVRQAKLRFGPLRIFAIPPPLRSFHNFSSTHLYRS